MTEYSAVLAKTGVVQQREVATLITKEALQSLVDGLNTDRSLPFIVEHDPSGMPIGKVTQAWLEPSGADWVAKGRIQVEHSARRVTHERSGAELVRLDFRDAPEPFVRRYHQREPDALSVGVDLANFESTDHYAAFKETLEQIDSDILQKDIGRHSAIPEPLIEFILSDPVLRTALTVWLLRRAEKFAAYTVDETLKKAADELVELISVKISKIVRAFRKNHAEVDAPVANQIVIPGELAIVLVVSLEAGEEFPGIDLKKLTKELEKYSDLLRDAEEARFAWSDGSWKLLYMMTGSGQAIGTTECLERTLSRLERAEHREAEDFTIPSIPRGVSIGGLSRSDEQGEEDEEDGEHGASTSEGREGS